MIKICHRTGVASVEVGRVTGSLCVPSSDEISVEEPLEIRSLLGFVRDARFNVYSDFGRIDPADILTHSA